MSFFLVCFIWATCPICLKRSYVSSSSHLSQLTHLSLLSHLSLLCPVFLDDPTCLILSALFFCLVSPVICITLYPICLISQNYVTFLIWSTCLLFRPCPSPLLSVFIFLLRYLSGFKWKFAVFFNSFVAFLLFCFPVL